MGLKITFLLNQLALQIHKTKATLEYAVVDLKPPKIYHGRALEIATILIGQRRK